MSSRFLTARAVSGYRGSRPKCSTNLHYCQAVKTRPYVIDHDARAFRKALEMSYRRRLDDIEPSKKYKAQQQRLPRDRRRDQSNELAGHFVDHDELRIFQAAGAGDPGGGWNSDEHHGGG